MKIKPVESIISPNYPDKYSSESKQAVSQAMPIRWKKAPLALSLSAAVALGLSGCQERETPNTDGNPPDPQTQAPVIPGEVFIPLFEFGEGTGGFVCIAINAPAFFSEEEAFAILASSFKEAGLTVDTTSGLSLPDLSDISIEFISIDKTEQIPNPSGIAASSFSTKSTAQKLAESNPLLAVFYDPVVYGDMDYNTEDWQSAHEKAVEQAKVESEQLLRQQANAFIEWLQQEGLIQEPSNTDYLVLGGVPMPIITEEE
jgi:hypothetical protein